MPDVADVEGLQYDVRARQFVFDAKVILFGISVLKVSRDSQKVPDRIGGDGRERQIRRRRKAVLDPEIGGRELVGVDSIGRGKRRVGDACDRDRRPTVGVVEDPKPPRRTVFLESWYAKPKARARTFCTGFARALFRWRLQARRLALVRRSLQMATEIATADPAMPAKTATRAANIARW